MQYLTLLALASAAAVVSSKKVLSKTYKVEVEVYEKYDCDATSGTCYAPKSYGGDYKPKEYSYGRKYPYPGPKERFCKKVAKFFGAIKKLVKKILGVFKAAWHLFKAKWELWCKVAKSDYDRFEDWKSCQADKFKAWWEYHHDLCKTRKQLWDDAMREFHRQWCHYKHTRREEYENRKKTCGIKDKDYDDKPDYGKKISKYGASPIEDQYKQYSSGKDGNKYDPAEYKKECEKRDEKYKKENNGSDGHEVGTTPIPGPPAPEPVQG
jgi:hypothetical protein